MSPERSWFPLTFNWAYSTELYRFLSHAAKDQRIYRPFHTNTVLIQMKDQIFIKIKSWKKVQDLAIYFTSQLKTYWKWSC